MRHRSNRYALSRKKESFVRVIAKKRAKRSVTMVAQINRCNKEEKREYLSLRKYNFFFIISEIRDLHNGSY